MLPDGNRFDERKGNMARRRYQAPTPQLRGNAWIIRIREDVIQSDGTVKRKQRPIILGYRHEIATARLARRAAEPILAKLNSTLYRPQRVVRFSAFTEKWKLAILPEMEPSSRPSMQSSIRAHLVPKFGDYFLHEITPEMIQSFVADLKSKVSDKTAWNIVMTMRSIWKTALAWKYTNERVFEGVRMRQPAPPDDVRCFSQAEVQQILAAAPEPHRTFYWMAAETGMRSSEICGLRWQDVDLSYDVIFVRRKSWRGKIGEPKNRRRRHFPISRQLSARLAEMQANRKPWTDLVFHSRNGTPWDTNLVVKRKLQPLLARLGIDRGGMHAFRHFNSSEMDRQNAPSGIKRDRLGHSSLIVTDRYTHSVSDDNRLVASKLAGSIVPNCDHDRLEVVAGAGFEPATFGL
jgi:integrase